MLPYNWSLVLLPGIQVPIDQTSFSVALDVSDKWWVTIIVKQPIAALINAAAGPVTLGGVSEPSDNPLGKRFNLLQNCP
jgi:hypothetical protein